MIIIFIFLLCLSIPYSFGEEWTIHVYTGSERFAGTDSNIFIRMFNSIHGYTVEYELAHENWLYGNALYPLKDLFESGGHDRFRISTGPFEIVERIHVRRTRFPLIRSDWFLDRIIIERNRDSSRFSFPCHCWLRNERPHITISISSDLQSIEKNHSLHDKPIIVVIFLVSLALIICSLYCLHEYCQRESFRPIEMPIESPIPNRSHPSAPPACVHDNLIPSASSQVVLRSVNTIRPVITQSTDEPPAYHDLFPD